jgi:hypothetical protein
LPARHRDLDTALPSDRQQAGVDGSAHRDDACTLVGRRPASMRDHVAGHPAMSLLADEHRFVQRDTASCATLGNHRHHRRTRAEVGVRESSSVVVPAAFINREGAGGVAGGLPPS